MKNHFGNNDLNYARQNFDRTLRLLNEIYETEDKQKQYDLSIHLISQFNDMLSLSFLPIYRVIQDKICEDNGDKCFNSLPQYRNYLIFLIENGFPLDERAQNTLINGLRALNKGETQRIFQSETLGLKGPAYTLARLQSLAMIYVNILHGWGLKKGEARLRVAAAYGYGENIETVRSWEGIAVKEFLGKEAARDLAEISYLLGQHNKGRQLDGVVILERNWSDNGPVSNESKETASAWEEVSWQTERELWDFAFPGQGNKDQKSEKYRQICSLNARIRPLPLSKCGILYQEALKGNDVNLGIRCPV